MGGVPLCKFLSVMGLGSGYPGIRHFLLKESALPAAAPWRVGCGGAELAVRV